MLGDSLAFSFVLGGILIVRQSAKPVCVLSEWPLHEHWERNFFSNKLSEAGIFPDQILWTSVLESRPPQGQTFRAPPDVLAAGRLRALNQISDNKCNVVLSLGEYCLEFLTGRKGIDKWQSSVLSTEAVKVIPCYPIDRINKDFSLQFWVSLCAQKAAAESGSSVLAPLGHQFLLNPPVEKVIHYLEEVIPKADVIANDIETGRSQINTIGFAVSTTEAIAINVLPEKYAAATYHKIMSLITKILEGDQTKVLQNFIYETLYYSQYGIRLRGPLYDTMIAQKFLFPELPMGLDSVGRIYSKMPYWKEDGKSWNDIRDWPRHYEYNCKDCVGTFEGYLGQSADLKERGLWPLHEEYLKQLYPCITEMCSWGLPVSKERYAAAKDLVEAKHKELVREFQLCEGAAKISPASPTQVKNYFKAKGYAIPKIYDGATKSYKESTNAESLKKMRLKHPEDPSIDSLLRLSKVSKMKSSYLSFTYHGDDRMRFMLNSHGAETGRFSGSQDPWGNGINPQTLPRSPVEGISVKNVFAASAGHVILECDLSQAESRYVAYDAPDLGLITMLEDPTKDVHRYVASHIFAVPEDKVTNDQRQLGKKSGHGANYDMKAKRFVASCLSEMDLVLPDSEGERILETYHSLFPGVRRRHKNVSRELCQNRMLRTPLGRERYFYGRMDEDTFRQAYAYGPQSTVPDIVNRLMLYLVRRRAADPALKFRLLLQGHDSVYLEVPKDVGLVRTITEICWDTSLWHPEINLAGGRLVIPTEVKIGPSMKDMGKPKKGEDLWQKLIS